MVYGRGVQSFTPALHLNSEGMRRQQSLGGLKMSKRLTLITAAIAGSALALAGSAFGQYDTGFETSDGINA